jgi:ornithine--oxo-acid transaminase
MGGPHFTKVVFANAGSESTEVALRFARQVTRRRRFLYVDGAFHGRSYGAISVCGWEAMRKGIDPAMPTCTPVRRNDIAHLRRELKMGDVAGFIFEPVQGMTGEVLDPGYLREAEALCEQHGTVMIADEIQCGLGRTGSWFVCKELGVRPHIMTVSKTLSGGQAAVGAVLVNENIYDKVYAGFGTGLVYFSTFAENNLAMAAALATLEALEEVDAPARAMRPRRPLLRDGVDRSWPRKLRRASSSMKRHADFMLARLSSKPSDQADAARMQHRADRTAAEQRLVRRLPSTVDLYGKAA